jgi:hypothetical protein
MDPADEHVKSRLDALSKLPASATERPTRPTVRPPPTSGTVHTSKLPTARDGVVADQTASSKSQTKLALAPSVAQAPQVNEGIIFAFYFWHSN